MAATPDFRRTPDDRFAGLPAFPYKPRYAESLPGYEGLRMHYVDEGPKDAERLFLCLHGEPTWSFLYRRFIPLFLESGARVIAPDFFGFGRSDKPTDDALYTFDWHRDALIAFIEGLDLRRITLVVQDWGGLLGLTLPHRMPERIERLFVMNTALGLGTGVPSEGFAAWRDYVASHPDFAVSGLMARAVPGLSDMALRAYDAPFPDQSYKAGARAFPQIVPVEAHMPGVDHSREAAAFLKEQWRGDSFMAIGLQDPVLGAPVMHALRETIRGCPEPLELPAAGHFVQEAGEEVARAALVHFGDIASVAG